MVKHDLKYAIQEYTLQHQPNSLVHGHEGKYYDQSYSPGIHSSPRQVSNYSLQTSTISLGQTRNKTCKLIKMLSQAHIGTYLAKQAKYKH